MGARSFFRSARFQFTRPRGARLSVLTYDKADAQFQFTRPRGARPRRAGGDGDARRFNSRAHGGRDVREAVRVLAYRPFQFTRPRGARPTPPSPSCASPKFQFTRPRGARRAGPRSRSQVAVSIHAPTGGATSAARSSTSRKDSFNSRAHGGRDTTETASSRRRTCFNSRAHGGRDPLSRLAPIIGIVSIHAPTGGATSHGGDARSPEKVSIHAPTGGATGGATEGGAPRGGFNSRAHGGRDLVRGARRAAERFQFTRPRGARRTRLRMLIRGQPFQFTRPRGARQVFQLGFVA